MSANIKASTDGTQAIIGVGGVDQMTVSNAGVVTANSFVGAMNSSSVTATGSTTARTLANRFADVVNVRDFGAVGDGVADDTAAISSVIQSNRTIYFPSGTYLITSQIVKTSLNNVYLIGAGAGNSKILCSATSVFSNSPIAFVSSNFIEISNFTIDQNNNSSLTATYPVFIAISSNNVSIKNCRFVKFTYIACALNSCNNSSIENNYFERDVAINSTNYSINVSSSVSVSTDIIVKNNYSLKASSIYTGKNIQINNNTFVFYKYGAGINTSQGVPATNYGEYIITNNNCSFGTGIDSDGVNVAGMEILGYNNIISGNICIQNGGVGIAALGYWNIISNNICAGNGTNLSATPNYRSGILMGYADATTNSNNNFVIGNKCYDLGSSSQQYGYYEDSSSLTGISCRGNDFTQNAVSPMYIVNSATGSYETQGWISYTPTMSSQTGTITTIGTCVGKYKLIDKTCFFEFSCTITTNGTAGGYISVTLPVNAASGTNARFSGRENGSTGKMLLGYAAGSTECRITNYDSTYPGGNGYIMTISGSYQTT
jgi:hypothetical protein